MVLYYYDWEGELSSDGENGLVELCDRCASELGDAVGFASDGTEPGSLCQRCEGGNGARCDQCHSFISLDEADMLDGLVVCPDCWESGWWEVQTQILEEVSK